MARIQAVVVILVGCLVGVSQQYEPGTTYRYSFQSDVFLNEDTVKPGEKTGRNVGYGILSAVDITGIWKSHSDPLAKIIKIQLVDPQLFVTPANVETSERSKHASTLDSAVQNPMYILQKGHEVVKVWKPSESITLSNIKKGIASLLQFQLTSGKADQVDISGNCLVSYKSNGQHIKKSKNFCRHPSQQQYFHPNHVQSPTVSLASETSYELLPDLSAVKSASSKEVVKMEVNVWSDANTIVAAQSKLKLVEQKQSQEILQGDTEDDVIQILSKENNLEEDSIIAQPEPKTCKENCKPLEQLVKTYKDNLKSQNLANLKSAIAFLRLLGKFRSASKKEILEILKNSKNKNIRPQLLDLAAAAQTVPSIQAALEILKFDSMESELPERFLVSLVTASHPSPEIIAEILKVTKKDMKNEKNKASALVTLGALIKTYCRGNKNGIGSKLVQEGLGYMETETKSCKTETCRHLYLRGLQNAAQATTIPTLLHVLKHGGKLSATIALRALKNIGSQYFTDEVYDVLEKVYTQFDRRQDSTARAIAAELIFLGNKAESIQRIIESLPIQHAPELTTFVTNKLFELMELRPEVRRIAGTVLQNASVGNYYNLAQSGSSAAFTEYLTQSDTLNATYGINMELIPGGLLKASSFDVDLYSKEDSLQLISVGLFAGGLNSFAGDSDDDPNEEAEDTTAGMRLIVMGVELRPYVFFVGTGELMGHVWSGTASDPTPALQGNLLFVDHLQYVPLLCGFVVELQLEGTISTDLSGSIQISLWNRNSHSVVRTSGAILIQGSAKVNTDIAESQVGFTFGGETYLDFITDLDFYQKPYKMCIQMIQPGILIRHNVRKYESIVGKQHLVRTLKKKTQDVGGKSYALHQKNFEYCSVMLTD